MYRVGNDDIMSGMPMAKDEVDIQERLEARVENPPKIVRQGPLRVSIPSRKEFFDAAFCSPTLKDLAGYFGCHISTIRDWFQRNPDLEALWNSAKSQDQLEVLTKARKLALGGSHPHLKTYLGAVRPDLIAPDTNIAINQKKTTIKVLPAPADMEDFKPFKNVLDGTATEVEPEKPEKETSGMPLFGGRIMRPT